ncbi:MAG: hypothetical protein H0U65_04240 [Rubrobacter sp.]|jgi:hypothetical protein|nr:hypothetical protein [Rubrobacter sp.]
MRIEHWPTEGIIRIDLIDGPDDYGHSIAEGVVAHYRRTPEGEEDILVDIEIEAYLDEGRDVSELHVEERDKNGNVALPAMIAKTLEELQRHGLVEQIKAKDTEKPKEMQKR